MSTRGPWIQTRKGRQFFVFDPRPDDFDIEEIAWALSMQCRYNGHTKQFMSVAQHSVMVAELSDPEDALWGLLHDAAEAFIGDMVRPLKRSMPEFVVVENRILSQLAFAYGLEPDMPASVKRADNVALATEQKLIMAPAPADWALLEKADPDIVEIPEMHPAEAFQHFMQTWDYLVR